MPNIKVKGYSGADLVYENVDKVYFAAAEGSEKLPFSYGDIVENVSVVLDLADGDQTVRAPEGTSVRTAVIKKPDTLLPENIRRNVDIGGVVGTLIGDTEEATVELTMADGDQVVEPSEEGKVLSKVTITKPETLIPENIAEGIDIAGIIGTLAADGAKVASGTFIGVASQFTLNHGLGVVPDLIILNTLICEPTYICFAYWFSQKFISAIGASYSARVSKYGTNGTQLNATADFTEVSTTRLFSSVTEETMNIGGSSNGYTDPAKTYHWIAIGGLT